MTIHEQLRALIQRDGRSLHQIAAAAGTDPGQLSRFARGHRGLNLDTTQRLLDALGATCKITRRRAKKGGVDQ